jgi:hypothetical protein
VARTPGAEAVLRAEAEDRQVEEVSQEAVSRAVAEPEAVSLVVVNQEAVNRAERRAAMVHLSVRKEEQAPNRAPAARTPAMPADRARREVLVQNKGRTGGLAILAEAVPVLPPARATKPENAP